MSSGTIALTGATGFVGGAVARRVADSGWRIRALVRPKADKVRRRGIPIEWVKGDLEDVESLRRLVRGADAVVHCAGAVRGASQAHFNRTNVSGTARLAKVASREHRVARFLLISSLAAREPSLSPYAASKRLGEKVLAGLAGEMSWAALRPPAIYGPGDREMLPLFRWMRRGVAPILGPGNARFSLLYVDDLAEAVLGWLDSKDDARRPFELHDGKPDGYTWGDVIDAAARLRGGPVVPLPVPVLLLRLSAALNLIVARIRGCAPMLTPGKVRELRHSNWVCDNARFHHETGWIPRTSLEEGLRRTLTWRP